MTTSSAGYSGTPLAKKLGIREGSRVLARNAPGDYALMIAPVPRGVLFQSRLSPSTDVVHLFCDRKARLESELVRLRNRIDPACMVWVSWPKQAAKVPTDITEGSIRELALPLGFVDVKVCAVDATWSGLKLVIRKALR